MKQLAALTALASGGIALIALWGGDPRGTHSLAASEHIVLAGLALAAAVALVAWRGARRSLVWLIPLVLAALCGGLSGWIAGVEFAGQTAVPVTWASQPARALFLVAMTVAGLALPTGLVQLAVRPRGRART